MKNKTIFHSFLLLTILSSCGQSPSSQVYLYVSNLYLNKNFEVKLYVNDVEVKFPSIILEKAKGTDNTSIWFDFYKVYLTDIDFVEGDNVIKLVMTGSGGSTNIDYLDLHAKGVLS